MVSLIYLFIDHIFVRLVVLSAIFSQRKQQLKNRIHFDHHFPGVSQVEMVLVAEDLWDVLRVDALEALAADAVLEILEELFL